MSGVGDVACLDYRMNTSAPPVVGETDHDDVDDVFVIEQC